MKTTNPWLCAFAAAFLVLSNNAPAQAKTRTGLDVLSAEHFAPFEGKNIGLITNHTGIDSSGKSAAELLSSSPKFRLVALFTPEHGLAGTAEGGASVGNSTYGPGKIPVYSLYGATRKPTLAMLKNVDILVFDMQDIGARFYTYLSTMALAMEETDRYGIPFFVLDRPNPLGGNTLEGPVLDMRLQSFTAMFPVPARHGMTAGELALLYAAHKKLALTPEVVRAQGWKRSALYPETGLGWRQLSPNIRDFEAALLYPGLGCFEATNISVGRGTDSPFHWFGAPWLDAKTLAAELEKAGIDGVKFSYEERTPASDLYAGKPCHGVRIEITKPGRVRALDIFVTALCLLRDMKAQGLDIKWGGVDTMTGSGELRRLYLGGAGPKAILEAFRESDETFAKSRRQYLLY